MVAYLILALAFAVEPATLIRAVAEGGDSPIRERLEVVIRTPDEWRALSNRFAPGKLPHAVNFAHEMAVGIFTAPGRFSGYRVEIISVAREGGAIVVRYQRRIAREGAGSLAVNSAPYQIVAVPRDRRRVKFIEVRELGRPYPE
jgi:hypothetical protein